MPKMAISIGLDDTSPRSVDQEITLLLFQEISPNIQTLRDVVPDGWMIDIHVYCFGKIYFHVSTSASQNGTPYQFHRLNTSEQQNKITEQVTTGLKWSQ